jgi:hypothetical protein
VILLEQEPRDRMVDFGIAEIVHGVSIRGEGDCCKLWYVFLGFKTRMFSMEVVPTCKTVDLQSLYFSKLKYNSTASNCKLEVGSS